METDKPVISVNVTLATEKVSVFVVLTTCNMLPAGNAAAARPVAFVRTNVEGVPKFGVVSVLFVSVCVAARPTKVSVPVGSVSVPEPATNGALIVMAPLVSPEIKTLLIRSPLLIDPMWWRYSLVPPCPSKADCGDTIGVNRGNC